jgi:hypothetical protein
MEAFIDAADELSRPNNRQKFSEEAQIEQKDHWIYGDDIWIDAGGHIHLESNIVGDWPIARLESLLYNGWEANISFNIDGSNQETCRIYRERNTQYYSIQIGDLSEMFDSPDLFLDGARMFFDRVIVSHEDEGTYEFHGVASGTLTAFLTAAQASIWDMTK